MIRLFANANYDFIKWRRWAYGLTAALIIPGFALFLVRGLNYSIEFTGGTLIQVQTKEAVGTERIRSALDAAGIRDAEIQQFGGPTEYKIQARIAKEGVAEGSTEATAAAVDSALARGLGSGPEHYTIVRTEAVGPKVGRELQGKAFLAIFFSFIVTLVYLAFRFEWRFGLAAVLGADARNHHGDHHRARAARGRGAAAVRAGDDLRDLHGHVLVDLHRGSAPDVHREALAGRGRAWRPGAPAPRIRPAQPASCGTWGRGRLRGPP